jgi:hypothetical protein
LFSRSNHSQKNNFMKRILFLSSVFLSVIATTLFSCKKEKPDTETQSATDNTICETEFTRSMSTINGFAIKEQGVKSVEAGGGPTIIAADTVQNPGWPRVFTIDYGTTGITDSVDGKIRKGQVVVTVSNRWHIVGSYIKVNLINYSVNGVVYACDSMKIIHSAQYAYTHQVFKGKCIGTSYNLSWEANRTLTQTGGTATPFFGHDDVFQITGSASGVNRNNLAYTVNITSPIVKRTSCSWIESGRLDITPDGKAIRTVDYGNGNCDNQATLTINGNAFAFTMQ